MNQKRQRMWEPPSATGGPISSVATATAVSVDPVHNPDEISLEDDEEPSGCCPPHSHNPDEIAIDDEPESDSQPTTQPTHTQTTAASAPATAASNPAHNDEEINIDDM